MKHQVTDSTDRISRERKFHNQRFGDDSGKPAAITDRYNMIRPPMDNYKLRLLSKCEGKRVLEYGCGPNTYAERILHAKAASVTGIDISDEAIRISQAAAINAKLGDRARFLRMNAEQLEFESASFDIVCGVAILHHLDLAKAIPEIKRVLVPGGRCIFVEPLDHNPLLNLYRRMTPSLRTPDEHPLKISDISFIRSGTNGFDCSFFNLTTLPMHFVARILPDAVFSPGVKALQSVDGVLFKAFPPIKWWAWTIVLEFLAP